MTAWRVAARPRPSARLSTPWRPSRGDRTTASRDSCCRAVLSQPAASAGRGRQETHRLEKAAAAEARRRRRRRRAADSGGGARDPIVSAARQCKGRTFLGQPAARRSVARMHCRVTEALALSPTRPSAASDRRCGASNARSMTGSTAAGPSCERWTQSLFQSLRVIVLRQICLRDQLVDVCSL